MSSSRFPAPDDGLDDSSFRAAIAGIMADARGAAPGVPPSGEQPPPTDGSTCWYPTGIAQLTAKAAK